MDGFGKELSPKQHQAIQALIVQPSIPNAATSACVSVRSLYRWLDEPTFRLALNNALDRSIDAAARGMVGLTEKALRIVETVLDDEQLHPATRLRAADLVLSNMLKLAELRTLAQLKSCLVSGCFCVGQSFVFGVELVGQLVLAKLFLFRQRVTVWLILILVTRCHCRSPL